MGDKKPSDYYRTLRRLAGSSTTVGDELLKKLWMAGCSAAIISLMHKLIEGYDRKTFI